MDPSLGSSGEPASQLRRRLPGAKREICFEGYKSFWGRYDFNTHCGISSVTVQTSLLMLTHKKSLPGLILGGYIRCSDPMNTALCYIAQNIL